MRQIIYNVLALRLLKYLKFSWRRQRETVLLRENMSTLDDSDYVSA
jgi:hypothetical protein